MKSYFCARFQWTSAACSSPTANPTDPPAWSAFFNAQLTAGDAFVSLSLMKIDNNKALIVTFHVNIHAFLMQFFCAHAQFQSFIAFN
jgi:hypothetical protein